MVASLLEPMSLAEQVRSLIATVGELRSEIESLRLENAELRQQVSELKCEVGYWKSRHADAVERNVALQAELDQAKAEIRQLKAERFGKRSEKRSSSDRTNDLIDTHAPVPPRNKRGQQPGRTAPKRRDYSHLPAREQTVDVPSEAQVCACCGLPLEGIGYGDDHEQIEIETIIYRRIVRRKRYRSTCNCVAHPRTVTAPLPAKLLPKSIYGTSLWVHLLVEKFHLQRPTQRTIAQLRLLGVNLAPGTIADGMKRIEPLLEPIYAALRARHQQSTYFHADETRWKVLIEKAGKVGHCWWLWLFAGEDSIVYVLDPSRSHDVPQSHFSEDAQGTLSVDRYSGYKAMQQVKAGQLQLAFCWAHVRRDFVRVGKGFPTQNAWALAWLGQIRELYRLNRQRQRQISQSSELAATEALLRQHVTAMAALRDHELASEKLHFASRKALLSMTEHWSGLTLFVDDPRIPLDNNFGERLIRNPAVGRKNYYGSGAQWSGRLAMMLFSIFATLVLWKINPRTWLHWYLEVCAANQGQAPSNSEDFLPWNCSEETLEKLGRPANTANSNTS
jgi:transposase